MSNDHIKSEISSYLAGGLPESRNRQIEAHAAACEKCRSALTKARAKQARVKREALKKADAMPNLFLTRQGKMAGVDGSSTKAPWILLGLLLLAAVGYKVVRRATAIPQAPIVPASQEEPSAMVTSSATVSAAKPVVTPSVSTAHAEPKPPVILFPKQEWKGAESSVKESRVVVVRNVGAWDKLWSEMVTGSPLPPVNFDDFVVFGVFAGERPAGATIVLDPIREMEDEVSVPFRVTRPEVAVSTGSAIPPSHPYLLSMVSRVNKKIRLSER